MIIFCICLFIGVIALWIMLTKDGIYRRGNSIVVPSVQRKRNTTGHQIDDSNIDDLAEKISELVVQKLSSIGSLTNIPSKGKYTNIGVPEITIDESIIDVGSSTEGMEFKKDKLGEERESVDEGLSKSKNRLSQLKKNRK